MGKLLVTGATGHLGRQSIEFLITRVPAGSVAALARDPAKAADLTALGVEVRQGDYADPASLERAFAGIDRLLMVSTVMFTDTITHHRNIVAAAKAAGVGHIVYTGIQRREGSGFAIDMVTETDVATEAALRQSGLDWTLMRNSLYLDSLPLILGPKVRERGLRVPAGAAVAALGARRDFAEANAAVLTSGGHAGRIYSLGAGNALSFSGMARELGVPYAAVDRESFIADRLADGLPPPAAGFLWQWGEAVALGEFAEVTGDLERLIGRRPMDAATFLAGAYAAGS
ncbi:NAD(P)H-binding protein [Niveispirillum sp. KHB5.9]|uniref:NAD(P)H-binding protein n=1 Tax=Niveispirillum sp. KHB5.9 TaxID=3400269 RepID=UPI003A836D3F